MSSVPVQDVATELGWNLEFRQTNREGELVDWIRGGWRSAGDGESGRRCVNAAAYTHTSIALHDAIVGSGARVIEVHISNVYSREAFRQHSYVSPVAAGIIVGFGVLGYPLAMRALASLAER